MGVPVRVVSVERSLFEGEVDGQGRPFLVCEGVEGELGILPRHAPLLTTLRPGPVYIRNGSEETELFVGGGFLEVLPDRVTILADVAEAFLESAAPLFLLFHGSDLSRRKRNQREHERDCEQGNPQAPDRSAVEAH